MIAAGGRLGGYGGQRSAETSLLVAEGVPVAGGRVRDLERVRWQPAADCRISHDAGGSQLFPFAHAPLPAVLQSCNSALS